MKLPTTAKLGPMAGIKSAAAHDLEGTTPPKWCGSVIPRTFGRSEQYPFGVIPCKGLRQH